LKNTHELAPALPIVRLPVQALNIIWTGIVGKMWMISWQVVRV
jgi:hypothetical protein